jgi:multidrug efflux pump subunit AcrB
MGSTLVNDFNILGRTYRVTAQADNRYRLNLQNIANLKTRNASGEMVPILLHADRRSIRFSALWPILETSGEYRFA